MEKDNLTYEFDLFNHDFIDEIDRHNSKQSDFDDSRNLKNIKCYFQYYMKCNKVKKTAGMGDTISSTGFIHHLPKNPKAF